MKYNKQWLREEELEMMLSKPDIPEKYEIWLLLMYTPGLRVSEALNVKVRDLDMKNGCIDIWGGKGRDDTEMQKAVCDIKILKRIKRFCEHSDLRPNDYIMFSQKSKQVHRSQVYRVLNDICHDVGIDKTIGTHTMRRSRAEHLLDRGLPITFVSKYLRHKNLSTTMKYLDVSVADIQREMEKIDDNVGTLV
ncbi:integrase family protein [Methanolobus psychrophilus R15]|nr:integrase family protein [Methanolobus psychrophilus R15]